MGDGCSTRSVLKALPKRRIVELGRRVGVALSLAETKDSQIDTLLDSGALRFRPLLGHLGRDELRVACRAHGLDDSGRARPKLATRLLEAHGEIDSVPPQPIFKAHELPRYAPRVGDIALCRQRQWLVEEVRPPGKDGQQTLVRLVCLDDDNQGRARSVLWERELGARVLRPETQGLGDIEALDPPRYFAAYLHALKWSSVTATDARLFQAPFRAGIQLKAHQLTPLKKALSLPRANLFIADDVGLGKTIEAGLVLQELLLRQRVDFALIICPAAVALQWKGEMERRFGLHFEIMNRPFIARRRQERGFGVNPWATHNRFIVSHQTIRRPEYRDPLLQHIGERAQKSLLILDEAHVAAPASAAKYAVDSHITRVIRDVAPRFENRLFLSATPHNGHSNSFSALLEILDPQRFTRGVAVDPAALEAVMVRRLKADLRELGHDRFPRRSLVQHTLEGADAPELQLARMLAEYTSLAQPKKGRARLVFINLQKRLLSSVEAFYRTLRRHHDSVLRRERVASESAPDSAAPLLSVEEYGESDEDAELRAAGEIEAASKTLKTPEGRARELLADMLRLAEANRGAADDKAKALLAWIREHQCLALKMPGEPPRKRRDTAWSDRRVLIFTEYGDTKRWLWQLLREATAGTDQADARILQFHGGMSDEQREEVQGAFNAPPGVSGAHPVRILIATDAAREGVNLQGHCADLFHFDIPWNPARLEQRNGRIDRTLQPADEVRCHYFVYRERPEDLVLESLVAKVDTIQRELGSLGAVLMDQMAEALEDGIGEASGTALARADAPDAKARAVTAELETQRADLQKLDAEIEESAAILNRSRAIMDFDPALLRDALNVGLELAGAAPLAPLVSENDAAGQAPERDRDQTWEVPPLGASWQPTLDSLRPPRGRDEPLWEHRQKAPRPVRFEPPRGMGSGEVHLHLEHPFVQRILGRFRAQGFSAHDLSRVTVVRTRNDALTRVIAFGRLSLFGTGAARLHDQLISVAARWPVRYAAGSSAGSDARLLPFAEEADRKAVAMLEQTLAASPSLEGITERTRERVREAAPQLFSDLWPHIRDDADAAAKDATTLLARRGAEESEALRQILARQRLAIIKEIETRVQLGIDFDARDKTQRQQFEQDQRHMEDRLARIQREIESEPAQIEALYRVALRRLEPVGLVVLLPEGRS